MRKPKLPKMGKQPKASASAETWERFYSKEADKIKDYEAKLKKYESDKTKVKNTRKKVQLLKQKRSK